MQRSKFAFVTVWLFWLCGMAFAQAKHESALGGRVLLDDGQPAAGAMIEIRPVGIRNNTDEQRVQCDETGSFKLAGIAPGSYSISALAPGYVSADDASARHYRPGETATIRLVKGGVITGRVTDVTGELLVGADVKVQRLRDLNGKSVRNGESSMWGNEFQTDDRGIYRVYGLLPGVYIVGVESNSIERWVGGGGDDAPTYYPSTTRDAAMEITIRPGDESTGIDIRYRGDSGHAISGTVSGATDSLQHFRSAGITLIHAATKQAVSVTSADQTKTFVFFGIPDGEYELYARMNGRNDEAGSGSAPQRVLVKGADVTGLNLRMTAYGTISGRVILEPAKPGETKCESKTPSVVEEILIRSKSLFRNPRSLNALLAEIDESYDRPIAPNEKGDFTLLNLEPDAYRIEPDLPGESWFVRSITLPPSGAVKTKMDVARSPLNLKAGEKISGLEITLAEGAASLAGRIIAKENGNSPNNLRVHLIPAEATAADDVLRYREDFTEKDGSFEFKHLAPGKYRMLARSITDTEKKQSRPAAFDATERLKLRKDAEAANNELELKPCQRIKDYVLRW